MKKHYILHGLRKDDTWNAVADLIRRLDMHKEWTYDEVIQHLTNEEYTLIKTTSSSSSSNSSQPTHSQPHALSSSSSRGSYRGRGRGRGRGRHNHSAHYQDNNRQRQSSHRGRGSNRGRSRNDNNRQSDVVKCFNCNGFGHTSNKCSSEHAGTRCFACGKTGHTSQTCNKNKRPFNEHIQGNSSNNNGDTNKRMKHSSYCVITSLSSSDTSLSQALHTHTNINNVSDWILDGGASDHCASNIDLLTDVRTLSPPHYIKTANGMSTCTAKGTATIRLSPNHTVTLHDVLYVPDFHVNLLSVFKITCAGAEVLYKRDAAFIMNNNTIDFTINRQNNIYVLNSMTSPSSSQ